VFFFCIAKSATLQGDGMTGTSGSNLLSARTPHKTGDVKRSRSTSGNTRALLYFTGPKRRMKQKCSQTARPIRRLCPNRTPQCSDGHSSSNSRSIRRHRQRVGRSTTRIPANHRFIPITNTRSVYRVPRRSNESRHATERANSLQSIANVR
jgi:hypothetical protein